MKYQMKNFITTFGGLCEFEFFESRFDCTSAEPMQFFVDRGVPAPFKEWMNLDRHYIPATDAGVSKVAEKLGIEVVEV